MTSLSVSFAPIILSITFNKHSNVIILKSLATIEHNEACQLVKKMLNGHFNLNTLPMTSKAYEPPFISTIDIGGFNS